MHFVYRVLSLLMLPAAQQLSRVAGRRAVAQLLQTWCVQESCAVDWVRVEVMPSEQ